MADRRSPRRPARRVAATAGPVAGVDEAGRGPVLGPLVVAGVLVDDEDALRALGVKDSKKLAPTKREEIAPLVRATARAVVVRVVEPADLDLRMGRASLNDVEADLFADVLSGLGAARAIVDACDVDPLRFGEHVRRRVAHACEITSEHKADDRYPCVAAASIVAKVERDRLMAAIATEYGADVGSGYPHDPRTRAWLAAFVARTGALPPCARARWETSSRLVAKDRSLFEFST